MRILLLAGLCLLVTFGVFSVQASPPAIFSPLPTPTATQQPCPTFEFDTQLPRPDIRKNYIGRHYDSLKALPGYSTAYSANIMDNPRGYRLTKIPRRNGGSMYWLERVVCRDATGRPYFEIVDVLFMPRLAWGQDEPSYGCYLGDTFIPNVIAIGYLNPHDATVILNSQVLRPFRRMTSVWYVDPFLKRLTQLNREDVTCYQFVELNPFLTPTARPTITNRPAIPALSP